ncbi:BLUF domain-containing protein [Azospirillum picis]|uniref:BLUF domain-containing protein n=1 Tax=Azospirillum picis TaxID=488438 RepID=A0ABU0MU46_9PROT|nr:BLUF domain-containing protein [Azospirillum picis]MBP2302869.1 hypothetical protein [Azospirillum picis]MDQ0536626.1 hypothetical protein [Azospirillum picis]
MYMLVFRSELNSILSYNVIKDICILSARNNRRHGISGFMIECGGVFVQILEGSAEAVDATFQRVSADARHHHVDLLLSTAGSAGRQFGAWAMNLMFLDDPLLWRRVAGSLSSYDDFLRRSRDPVFSLGLLSLAYQFACSAINIDPAATGLKRGRIPRTRHMLRS